MGIRFPKAKRGFEKRSMAEHLDSLRRACKEYERQDLYEPLSRVLNPNIRWLDRDQELFLKMRCYVIAVNVMLYESKTESARRYLEEALRRTEVGSARHRRLATVLANLKIVAKIARRSWEIDRECTSMREIAM
jgi:hypothetical protein